MRLFCTYAKSELLSRSSSRSSFFFLHFNFLGFFCFFSFFSRLCFRLCFSSRSSGSGRSSRSSSFLSRSSECNSGERNSYEGGNDCGHNFFHLYYLQRDMFDRVLCRQCANPARHRNALQSFVSCKPVYGTMLNVTPHSQHAIPQMR